jgi:molybdopterin-containing oxidoreductase family membrane subunit
MATIANTFEIDNTVDIPGRRAPLVTGNQTLGSITNLVCGIAERPQPLIWYIWFAVAISFAGMFFSLIAYLLYKGVGIWGNMSPVFWAWPIVNFVFWVGIAHAGTLISAILYLFRQNWRTSINRAAEAMTIFAVVCAGIFPRRSRLVGVLANSLSKFESLDVAAIPQSFALGRVCGRNVRFGVAHVLVYGNDPRFGNVPRS